MAVPGPGWKVVIVGAGFAGLNAALELSNTDCQVLVLDRENYHVFQPLLYQVACAELEAEEVTYPVRGLFRDVPNVEFRLAELQDADLDNNVLHTDMGDVPYDALILACGSMTSVHDIPGAAEHAHFLKTLDQAVALRNQIMSCCERAAWESDPEERRRLLTFVIVGGGPTGVEFAGALAELLWGSMRRDFAHTNLDQSRIVLVQHGEGLLPSFPEELRDYALSRLRSMGVEVRLGCSVREVRDDSVLLNKSDVVGTRTTIWCAGVTARPLGPTLGLETGHSDRIKVRVTLQTVTHDNVFVAGDLGIAAYEKAAAPQVAPAAIQQGELAGRNALKLRDGERLEGFQYHDKGQLAVIGRSKAVAQVGSRSFTAFPAWVLWALLHLHYLIGFRNRMATMLAWGLDYVFKDKTIRLLFPRRDTMGGYVQGERRKKM